MFVGRQGERTLTAINLDLAVRSCTLPALAKVVPLRATELEEDSTRCSKTKSLWQEAPTVGFVENRNSRYRARYRDPLGRLTSKTFVRKADAQRFLARMAGRPPASHPDPRHPLALLGGGPVSPIRRTERHHLRAA